MTSGSKCAAVSKRHRDRGVPCKVTGLGGHFQQAKCQDSECLILKIEFYHLASQVVPW